jgi:hypothetical protein
MKRLPRCSHFHVGNGVLTVAGTDVADGDTCISFHFGGAYCSPKDTFNRKLAVRIARGRLETHLRHGRGKFTGCISFFISESLPPLREKLREAANMLIQDPKVPQWAKGAIPRLKVRPKHQEENSGQNQAQNK